MNELELLLKSTVQNIKPTMVRKVKKKPAVERPEGQLQGTGTEGELTEDGQKASPDHEDLESGDHEVEGDSAEEEEFEIIEGTDSYLILKRKPFLCHVILNRFKGGISDGDELQQKNISKILGLLDEIRDPFAGHSAPAMIGLEYVGELHTI